MGDTRGVQGTQQPADQTYVEPRTQVIVVDFDVPFLHLMGFLIKLVFASIPAALIVGVFSFVFWMVVAGMLMTR